MQGLVHVSSMTDDYYVFNEKAHALKGENTRKVYRLGDKVEVQVVRVDLERRQVDFALVDVLERAAAGARKGRPPAARAWPRAAGPARGQRPTETRTPRGLAHPGVTPGAPSATMAPLVGRSLGAGQRARAKGGPPCRAKSGA